MYFIMFKKIILITMENEVFLFFNVIMDTNVCHIIEITTTTTRNQNN